MPLPPEPVEEIEAIVSAVQDELERGAALPRSEVRWVRLEGLHLTLRFLGAIDPERVADIGEAVARAATRHDPFEAVISGAGAFPDRARPRTLWLGVEVGQDELRGLARSLDEELDGLGWRIEDRPFRPHLTLARADGRREGPRAARLLVEQARPLELRFVVDRVVLFESVTGGGPARYLPLREARLGHVEGASRLGGNEATR